MEEIEIKLALPPAAQRAFLRHPLLRQAERLPARRLLSIYHDTPDLALRRHGIALRLRRQGRRWLQTVKAAGVAAGGLAVRPEWEQPFRGRFDFSAVDDAAVRRQLEAARLHQGLVAVFETDFTRRAWRLTGADGTRALLLLDRGRIVAGGREEPLCELEIELEAGETAALYDIALRLAAGLPLRPEIRSKAERGYRLHTGEPLQPCKAGPSPIAAGLDPVTALRRLATACLAQFEWNALGAENDDPEFVHQMRVALRRLRSALRLFRPLLPAELTAAAAALHTLSRQLGQARDLDVVALDILAPVQAAFPHDPRLRALAAVLEQARHRAHAAVAAAVAAPEQAHARLALAACLQKLAPGAQMPALSAFAARRLDRLYRKVRARAAAAAGDDPLRLHALRIAVKRLRYALEFFAPLYPRRAVRKALTRLAALQDGLGALNDLARAGTLLMQGAGEDPRLREAVALVGGWHGPRHAELRERTFRGMRRLGRLERFWKEK